MGKVEILLQSKILDKIKDTEMIRYLNAFTGAQWFGVSIQLRKALPTEDSVISVEIEGSFLCQVLGSHEEFQNSVSGVSGQEISTRRQQAPFGLVAKTSSSHCKDTISELLNRVHGGVAFTASGLAFTGSDLHFVGTLSFVYCLKACFGKEKTLVAVKVLFEEKNQNALNELEVLKKLQAGAVPNVVRPFGSGCQSLKVSAKTVLVLTLNAVNVDSTDKTLRKLMNFNEIKTMATHVLDALRNSHSIRIVHGNLEDPANLLYNAIDQTTVVCGWSQGSIVGPDSESILHERVLQDAHNVGTLLLSLVARKKDGEQYKFDQVERDLDKYVNSSLLAFNILVEDESRRMSQSSPLVIVIRGLIQGNMSVADGFGILSASDPVPEQHIERLFVPPRYLQSTDSISYPVEIREKYCFNEQGEKVLQHGTYVVKETPSGVPLGSYAGVSVTAAYGKRLVSADKEFHLISTFKAGGKGACRHTLDGRKHAIYDHPRASKTGQVQIFPEAVGKKFYLTHKFMNQALK
jgi:hypothetical protein